MCNLWPVDLLGRPRVADVLPELCNLPSGGADENTVQRIAQLLWPESALAPQRLWPSDEPAPPPGDDLSPSPGPPSPTSPNYDPPECLAPDFLDDPLVFDSLQLD